MAAIALLPPGADAHHPEITASASCADGLATVRIVAVAWDSSTPDHRQNPDIGVSFGGQSVGRGAFLPGNGYTFTVVHQAPADGRTYTVRATSLAPWGVAGEYGSVGEYSQTRVTLPSNCEAPTTTSAPTTTVPATTSTAAPTTTTVSGSGSGVTSTTAPAVVGGVVETRPDVAVPVNTPPRFAG